jgi:hypothetical protein
MVRARFHPGHVAVHAVSQPLLEPAGNDRVFPRRRDTAAGKAEPYRLGLEIG